MRFDRQKTVVKFVHFGGSPFARNEVRSSKTAVKLRFGRFRGNPFVRNKVRVSKTGVFFATLVGPAATLSHETRFEWLVLLKVLCVKVSVCKSICV